MEKVKILHSADFHFDTPFGGLVGNLGEKRKEDLRETFGKMVNIAREEDIRILLLAGDLFDNARVSRPTIDYLISCLMGIPQIRVFISPGNHDPYHEKSYYHLVDWPENVHIFRNDYVEKVEISELNACVYGCAFTRPHVRESLLNRFVVEDPTKINIMLLHGDIVTAGQGSDYNPLTIEGIAATGLDYLALGHLHSHTGIHKVGNTSWAYSGCPEGRAFDEQGEKGILLGEIGKGECQLSFHALAKRRYFEIKVDISNFRTYEEITVQVLETVREFEPAENLFKLVLHGDLPTDFTFYPSVLKGKLEGQFYYLHLEDETATGIDPQLLANDFTLRGVFVKKTLERSAQAKSEAERRKMGLVLKYGLRILEQGEAGIE